MNEGDQSTKTTRERIIQIAAGMFAERGFQQVTVRDICSRAGANLAAVNYHFRDKEGLYLEVFRYARSRAFEEYPLPPGGDGRTSPEVRLRGFVRTTLLRILDEGEDAYLAKLMAREFMEPTRALDMMLEETIRPTFHLLGSIVRDLLGEGASEQEVRLCCASVVGQCLHYFYARPVVERLFGLQGYSGEMKEALVEHIVSFSLRALKKKTSKKKGAVK